jgi:hypothetical protein
MLVDIRSLLLGKGYDVRNDPPEVPVKCRIAEALS